MNSYQKELDKIYNEVSLEVYIPKSKVKETIEGYYSVIKDMIEEIDLEQLDKKDFPTIKIPIIGRLVVQNYRKKRILEAKRNKNAKSKI
jgi:hypothetical protein